MNLCADHLAELHTKIEEAGLNGFVSDPSEYRKLAMDVLTNGPTAENFDALMYATSFIFLNASRLLGNEVITNTEKCPMCAILESCNCELAGAVCPYREWVGLAASEVREKAEALGLIGQDPSKAN